MTDAPKVIVAMVDGRLQVDGDEHLVTDVVVDALAADKEALRTVVETFGSVEVRVAGRRAPWPPPNGGWDPAERRFRRVSPKKVVLDILPSEHVVGRVDPYADAMPTIACRWCTGTTWHRAGSGWTCATCHPPVPADLRETCPICGGKGACRPDHDARLRQLGERLLRRTRSVKRQAAIEAALATLPEAETVPVEASRERLVPR
jgi:hypothetical protein